MLCPRCNLSNPEGARFCAECGGALGRACAACGTPAGAAQKFCSSCGHNLAAAPDALAPPAPDAARDEGERRHATILFSDISGFTALAEKLDPEEVADIVNRIKREAATIVEQQGGTVNQFVGDEIMALFGIPLARRDDAQRAVRAALELHRAVEEIGCEIASQIGVPLAMHSGVNTGLAIVRRSDARDGHYAVTGDTVNTASRLQGLAAPGEIVIGHETWRQVSALFEAEAGEPIQVKGKDAPIVPWRVRGERAAAESMSRPLVGRDEEVRQLAALVQSCVQRRRGRIVVVRGDPGIGKSRLLREFQSLAGAAGFACHSALILDFRAGKGRDAIGSLARSLVGAAPGSGKKARRAALARALATGLAAEEEEVFLCALLDVPPPPALRSVHAALSEAARGRGLREALCALVRRASERSPVAIAVEDLHWADSATLEQLAALGAVAAEHPVLLVLTTRFQGDPTSGSWRTALRGIPTTGIDLAPLTRDDALQLVRQFSSMPDAIAQACIDKAEGNALFLEQLLLNGEEAALANLPGSIQALVLARMDRLEALDRAALQAAAVLGQRFGLDALRHLVESERYDCRTLVDHYLLRPEGQDYLFCHALIRDGAYESLLKARRRQLHERAAEWFATRDKALSAEHYDRAGHVRAAAAYLAASDEEAARYQYGRALALAERGLAIAERREERYALTCARARILLDMGNAQEAIGSWQAALETADGGEERCRALIGTAQAMRIVDRVAEGLEALDRAQPLAEEAALVLELARLHHLRGNLYFGLGRPAECLAAHQAALARAREARSPEAEANALSGLGDANYLSGRMRSAHEQFSRCVELARQHGLGRIEVANRHMQGWTAHYLGQVDYAQEVALEAIEMARTVHHRRVEIIARHLMAYVAGWLVGDVETGNRHLQESLAMAREIGARRFEGQGRMYRALMLLRAGERGAARDGARDALAFCRLHGMEFVGPIALGLLARLTEDDAERASLLAEAEALLARGAISHNHFEFYTHAIEAAIERRQWQEAERYCTALEQFSAWEPLQWSALVIRRGRALARAGSGANAGEHRQALEAIRQEAMQSRYNVLVESAA